MNVAQKAFAAGFPTSWTAMIVAPLVALLLAHVRSPEPGIERRPAPPASAPPPPAADAQAEQGDDEEPSADCTERFWEPFARLHGRAVRGRSWKARTEEHAKHLADEYAHALRIDTMIALLPDPVDSGLAYSFDTQLEALQLALETDLTEPAEAGEDGRREAAARHGYQRDRDWLPWDDRQAATAQRARSEACRRELPGVVLFRASPPEGPRLLVLLVVGETPTAGPHATALKRALDIADGLASRNGDDCADSSALPCRRKLLGPSFSGSAEIVRRILDQHRRVGEARALEEGRRVRRTFQLISPTANGPHVRGALHAEGWLDFRATTVPQESLECAFLHFVHGLGAQRIPRDRPPHFLDEVGILTESGTSFGYVDSSHRLDRCRLSPRVFLTFPLQVSNLQKEYEGLKGPQEDLALARRTTLDVSLVGDARRDLATHRSSITKFAQDRALTQVLGQISREGIRWLGIRATSIADAIFLARKVRDVAPDVRLAFFTSDALLLHPEYQRTLLGSLVITPYPFLGGDDFSPRATGSADQGIPHGHHHLALENAEALGTFNAVLALRGARASELREYVFATAHGGPPARDPAHASSGQRACGVVESEPVKPLPIWISAVSRSGLVPLRMQPAVDCDQTIYEGARTPHALCSDACDEHARRAAWRAFSDLEHQQLHIEPDVTPPRLWYFVLAALCVLALVDMRAQRRMHQTFAALLASPAPDAPVDASVQHDDRKSDLRLASAQWHLFALVRRFLLLLAALYMFGIHCLATAAYTSIETRVFVGGYCLATLVLGSWTAAGVRHAYRSFDALRADRHPASLQVLLGFALAVVGSLAALLVLGEHVCASTNVLSQEELSPLGFSGSFRPAFVTLFGLRSLPLLNGVSPATPILICIAALYAWALGRSARARLLAGLSAMSPEDHVQDGVCTPIRRILFPVTGARLEDDGGFVRQERCLLDALARPSWRAYAITLFLVPVLPIVLFLLKRPSTLESRTWLLFAALAVIAVLIAVTLLQLLQYHCALDLLLKRIMTHPLGPAFKHVLPPLREAVDAQVSSFPNDLLRMVSCAQSFETLVILDRPPAIASGIELRSSLNPPLALDPATGMPLPQAARDPRPERFDGSDALEVMNTRLRGASDRTLSAMAANDLTQQARHQAELGAHLIDSAQHLMSVLLATRQGRAYAVDAEARRELLKLPSIPPPGSEPVKSPSTSTWLTRVESYVATVVALLLNRHVRQFRIFLYTATICALLLLMAIASYPFEPQRTLQTCLWLIMTAVVFTCLYVFVQLDRDPLLSHIGGHPESAGRVELGPAFAVRIALWVVVPLLSVLAAQYPEVANGLAWSIEPFTRALH